MLVSMLIATICNIPVSFLEVQMTHPLIQVDLGAVLGLVYMGVVFCINIILAIAYLIYCFPRRENSVRSAR